MDLPFLLRNGRLHDPIYERAMVNFIYSHIIDPRTAEYPSRAAHELLRGNAGHAGQVVGAGEDAGVEQSLEPQLSARDAEKSGNDGEGARHRTR